MDYQKRDAVITQDSYLKTVLKERMNSLGRTTILLKLDASSNDWQFKRENANKDKSAYVSPHDLHTSSQIPFKLCDETTTFEVRMDITRSSVKRPLALEYFDNIVVVKMTFSQHTDQVRSALSLHYKALVLHRNWKTFDFFTYKVNCLGYVICLIGLDLSSQTTTAIRLLKPRTILTDLRLFLSS